MSEHGSGTGIAIFGHVQVAPANSGMSDLKYHIRARRFRIGHLRECKRLARFLKDDSPHQPALKSNTVIGSVPSHVRVAAMPLSISSRVTVLSMNSNIMPG